MYLIEQYAVSLIFTIRNIGTAPDYFRLMVITQFYEVVKSHKSILIIAEETNLNLTSKNLHKANAFHSPREILCAFAIFQLRTKQINNSLFLHYNTTMSYAATCIHLMNNHHIVYLLDVKAKQQESKST